jgi:hypothetical protein
MADAQTTQDVLKDLALYSIAKIKKATVCADPFPYLFSPKLLPSNMFTAVNKFYPSIDMMGAMPGSRTGNPYAHQHRRLLALNKESLAGMEKEQKRFWKLFSAYIQILSPKLLKALPQPPSGQHFVTAKPEEIKTRIDLWSDRGGYQITPHTDAPHKLATFLLYCSSDPSLASEGTSIFTPRDPAMACWQGRQWPMDQFEEVYRAPYGANHLFGFRKTDKSFHGKLPVAESTQDRRTIAITIQTAENFVA